MSNKQRWKQYENCITWVYTQRTQQHSSRTMCSVCLSLYYSQAISKLERQTMTVPSFWSPHIVRWASRYCNSPCSRDKNSGWWIQRFKAVFFLHVLQMGATIFSQASLLWKPKYDLTSRLRRLESLQSAVTAFHLVFTGTTQTQAARLLRGTVANFGWCWTLFTVSFSACNQT